MQQGCRWRIGNGSNIDLWRDPWLRENENFILETPRPHNPSSLTLQDLWIPNSKEWDVELLDELFTKKDATTISNIPLNLHTHMCILENKEEFVNQVASILWGILTQSKSKLWNNICLKP